MCDAHNGAFGVPVAFRGSLGFAALILGEGRRCLVRLRALGMERELSKTEPESMKAHKLTHARHIVALGGGGLSMEPDNPTSR